VEEQAGQSSHRRASLRQEYCDELRKNVRRFLCSFERTVGESRSLLFWVMRNCSAGEDAQQPNEVSNSNQQQQEENLSGCLLFTESCLLLFIALPR